MPVGEVIVTELVASERFTVVNPFRRLRCKRKLALLNSKRGGKLVYGIARGYVQIAVHNLYGSYFNRVSARVYGKLCYAVAVREARVN